MRMLLLPTLLLLLGAPMAASAESLPNAGVHDPRVKTVAYNADDVVRIIGHYGFSTNIEFAPGEAVESIALGDSLAWEVAPRGNQLFVKPRENNATTNMSVITNRRSYQFWLDAARATNKGRGREMFFRVKFAYPAEEARIAREADAKQRAEAALKVSAAPLNWNYWHCGSAALRPTEVYDDGRFTYLRFPNAMEIPAAFVINSDRAESIASGTMRGDQLVLQTVAPKIILRKGKSVACVLNRSFNPYGIANPTGTTSPIVERRIKALPPPPAEVLAPTPRPYQIDPGATHGLPAAMPQVLAPAVDMPAPGDER